MYTHLAYIYAPARHPLSWPHLYSVYLRTWRHHFEGTHRIRQQSSASTQCWSTLELSGEGWSPSLLTCCLSFCVFPCLWRMTEWKGHLRAVDLGHSWKRSSSASKWCKYMNMFLLGPVFLPLRIKEKQIETSKGFIQTVLTLPFLLFSS